ncbi:MAG: DUF4440 domain-containing protein [Gemmatimonadota bacterium]
MRRTLFMTLLFALVVTPAASQSAAVPAAAVGTDPAAEVLATVQRLWDAMAAHDADAAAALFHPEARMIRVGERDGAPYVDVNAPAGFVAALRGAAGGVPWNETMIDPQVRVDGKLAMVWTGYTFHLGEAFSHCGVDAIHLVRTASGWQIIEIADTMRREGCPAGV